MKKNTKPGEGKIPRVRTGDGVGEMHQKVMGPEHTISPERRSKFRDGVRS